MDSETNKKITAALAQWCADNPIEVYAERDDFDCIEDYASLCPDRESFEEKLAKDYSSSVEYEIDEAIKRAKQFVAETLGKPELDADEAELVEAVVPLDCAVNYPYDIWARQEMRVALIIKGNAIAPHEIGYDMAALANLLSLFYDNGVPCTESAKASIEKEVEEAKQSGANVLCILATITLGDYFDLLEDPLGYSIELTPQHYVGLYDPWSGGGASFGIELPGKVIMPGEMVTQILLENSTGCSKGFRTPDSVYGFVSKAYVETRVFPNK